jgi:plasmid stabilization system protein ParE
LGGCKKDDKEEGMTYRVKFDDKALLQFYESYDYYEEQQIGLGDRFRQNLEDSIDYIQKYPHHFERVKEDIRQTLVPKFPFLVIYEVFGDTIVIYAIFHTSRNPKEKFKKNDK